MNSEPLDRVLDEVRALRDQNRRLRRIGIIAVTVLGLLPVAVAWAPSRTKSLETEELVLRDSEGRACARLYTHEGGLPALALFDSAGKTRLWLGMDKDSQSIGIYDGRDDGSIVMDVNRFGASSLYLRAEDGKEVRLLAARKPDNFAEISLGDDNGAQMTFTAGPKLRDMQLRNGKSLHVHVVSDNDGSADITFLGPNEKPVHVLGIDPNGRADARILGPDGKLKSSLPR